MHKQIAYFRCPSSPNGEHSFGVVSAYHDENGTVRSGVRLSLSDRPTPFCATATCTKCKNDLVTYNLGCPTDIKWDNREIGMYRGSRGGWTLLEYPGMVGAAIVIREEPEL